MHTITPELIEIMKENLINEEKSQATINKYIHDIGVFYDFVKPSACFDKMSVLAFKEYLMNNYSPASTNSYIAVVNYFMKQNGWNECCIKSLKVQESLFRSQKEELQTEEYLKLLDTAKKMNKIKIYYIMMTLAMTGIRIGELQFITVESLEKRKALVCLKGKYREIVIPKQLAILLSEYAQVNAIKSGSLFTSSNGKPLDRTYINRQMKCIAKEAGIDENKVFPHNFRHMFAVNYIENNGDINYLADILGHSSINTTRRYTKVTPEDLERRIEKMELRQTITPPRLED